MKKIILLLSVLLLLPLCAQAVTTVPEGITEIGSEAFANTDIDALIVPASVQTVGAGVLEGSGAAYLYLEGASTQVAGDPGTPFVFGPADSAASGLPGFYATETLTVDNGLYYAVGETAIPLCPQDPSALSGGLTIPKVLGGVPVTSLELLHIENTGVAELIVPQYLSIPEGLNAAPTQTMFVTAPTSDVAETPAGSFVTWTTSIEGAYGDVSYIWAFDVNGEISTTITAEPTVQFAPMAEGSCTVTVTAEDSLGDSAVSAASEPVAVTEDQRTYRALLIGNTYPGAANELPGPDNDIMAMLTVLNSMSGTSFKVTSAMNVTASGMQGAIASTFADAQPGDVSLFYYSGHGTSAGALVGTGNTGLSVYTLRSALQKIPGTKIVILDCCYSGMAIGRSAEAAAEESVNLSAFNSAVISALSSASRSSENLADQGFIVLTACSKDQLSQTLTDGLIDFGAFTYSLCYGSGYDEWNSTSLGTLPADANGDGAITLGEAYSGVRERIAYLNSLIPLAQDVQYYGDTSFILWSK